MLYGEHSQCCGSPIIGVLGLESENEYDDDNNDNNNVKIYVFICVHECVYKYYMTEKTKM